MNRNPHAPENATKASLSAEHQKLIERAGARA
jgi:hypothetical protein